MNSPIRLILAVSIVLALGACAKKQTTTTDTETDTSEPPVTTTTTTDDGRYDITDLDTDSCLKQRVVYFDYDRSEIKSEFQAIMGCHGKYLRDRPSAQMTLEGHADERGSREYNLGLGERRGNAVSSALQGSGGSAGQLTVVSYGEERPTCTESDEGCWSRNRRVEIVYTAK